MPRESTFKRSFRYGFGVGSANLLPLCVAASLAACASAPKEPLVSPRQARYVESEYAPYEKPGTGSIHGQAFLKTKGGEVKYAAGNQVLLAPVTAYTREWWTRTVVGDEVLSPRDEQADRFFKETTADGEGRFRFDSLPPGEYFVVTTVEWQYYAGYLEGNRRAGGRVGKRLALSPGERLELVLTSLQL